MYSQLDVVLIKNCGSLKSVEHWDYINESSSVKILFIDVQINIHACIKNLDMCQNGAAYKYLYIEMCIFNNKNFYKTKASVY